MAACWDSSRSAPSASGSHDHGDGLASPQRKGRAPSRTAIGSPPGPDFLNDFERLARHETEFEQSPADRGLRLVTEALIVVAHIDDTPGALAQRGKTNGGHCGDGFMVEIRVCLNEIVRNTVTEWHPRFTLTDNRRPAAILYGAHQAERSR